MTERLRCNHPSGTGMNPMCRRPAVGSVRVLFKRGWSTWILACSEHLKSKKWYRESVEDGVEVIEFDGDGYVEVPLYKNGDWRKVERGTLGDWRSQKRKA